MKKSSRGTWSVNDINNVEGADRKLSINGSLEFWVHDEALTENSEFLKDLFGSLTPQCNPVEKEKHEQAPLVEEHDKIEQLAYLKTPISIPHSEYFFDILTWMYTKDKKRLKKAALETESLLSLLNLGVFLRMHDDFFNVLLVENPINLSIKDFETELWSRTAFSFQVLVKVVEAMKLSNHEKLIALLSWMKEDFVTFPYSTPEAEKERETELLTSMDYCVMRGYIKDNKLMSGVDTLFLVELFKEFGKLSGLLDSEAIFKEFGMLGGRKVWCKICKRVFASPMDAARNPECEIRPYHPRSFVTSFRTLGEQQTGCGHAGCTKKLQRNEFPCCHQPSHSEGCTMGEGKHFIVIE
ncbi:MAG: hypothetical protein P4M11_14930 [Candidatus Pacebacteria bacterium]|nr:hypothetical protein [Candidatus Paceibacterota bacterium]